jgi:hypothetical protein
MMLESEKFAIAAHLHVLLRRVNGRVTDVEWMIRSAEYAREVIRVARTEQHADLLKLADKLEAALDVGARPVARPAPSPARKPSFAHSESADSSSYPASDFPASGFDGAPGQGAGGKRYVRSLR